MRRPRLGGPHSPREPSLSRAWGGGAGHCTTSGGFLGPLALSGPWRKGRGQFLVWMGGAPPPPSPGPRPRPSPESPRSPRASRSGCCSRRGSGRCTWRRPHPSSGGCPGWAEAGTWRGGERLRHASLPAASSNPGRQKARRHLDPPPPVPALRTGLGLGLEAPPGDGEHRTSPPNQLWENGGWGRQHVAFPVAVLRPQAGSLGGERLKAFLGPAETSWIRVAGEVWLPALQTDSPCDS